MTRFIAIAMLSQGTFTELMHRGSYEFYKKIITLGRLLHQCRWLMVGMCRQDVTSAAVRACKDAISSNSIPAFRTGTSITLNVNFWEFNLARLHTSILLTSFIHAMSLRFVVALLHHMFINLWGRCITRSFLSANEIEGKAWSSSLCAERAGCWKSEGCFPVVSQIYLWFAWFSVPLLVPLLLFDSICFILWWKGLHIKSISFWCESSCSAISCTRHQCSSSCRRHLKCI